MDEARDTMAHVRSVAGRAVATALEGPAGAGPPEPPVPRAAHPDGDLGAIEGPIEAIAKRDPAAGRRSRPCVPGRRTLDSDQVEAIARRLAAVRARADRRRPAGRSGAASGARPPCGGDGLPDPGRPALRAALRPARSVARPRARRPPRSAGAVDRRPPAGARRPLRGDARRPSR